MGFDPEDVCGKVDAAELVSLLTEYDFHMLPASAALLQATEEYRHLINCRGCRSRFGSYLEEVMIGNSEFSIRWRGNLDYLEAQYKESRNP